ncbi:dimeric alpha-beta barrel [Colletotrichum incanum]|uniref:Dimeric alpha-beta barrel n=1 Tax=Colletotrichum incanum TaxID=1573173 RepID=A0A167B2R4_COLIC|nr:dimeric alpha-beta barrel [Colletotrichum incanum]OHW94177.1 hypothetical protein CSPAE12_07093 [Colletotrichum incanum]
MSGPPSLGPTRVILDVVGDVPDWKEEYKKFLLAVKDSEGYFRYRWGPWKEDPSKLEILATWAPLETRAAFGKSPQHQKAIEALKPVLAGPVPTKCPRFDLDVSTFVPPPPQLINSPICEVITVRHCTGDPKEMAATLKKAEALPGCYAAHSGIGASNTPDQGTVWIGFVGWRDYESSEEADKSVYMPHGVGELESHHINFNFPIKGFSVTNPGR